MEAAYLLLSLISTLLTSIALSLLLLFRTLFTRVLSFHSTANATDDKVSIYEGVVWHERRCPVRHSFHYSVRYALFDLDCSPYPPDHLSANQARRVAGTTGPVFLLTIPPSVGYEQNPLSLYYCYELKDSNKHLKKCIAEVTNTPWGERVTFVFGPNSDLVAKPLHVSPFMDMQGNWSIRADAPGDTLFVSVSIQHPKYGDYFVATLKAKRISSLESDHNLFFWLMPHKVAFWIYWHAFKLWWKKVQFIQHPRYGKPKYREEAQLRDEKLQCCIKPGWDKNEHLQDERDTHRKYSERQFKWRDAKWPWC